jgi:succinate dehydrogenase / fumarate reductase iron-sulfur subunit
MLFVAAKVKHLGVLPQGQPERRQRGVTMLETMQEEGFGNCTNEYECEAVCPKEISTSNIAFLNREYIRNLVSLSSLRPLVTSE